MHGGKIVDAVIEAVLDTTDVLKYHVDFEKRPDRNGRGAATCERLDMANRALQHHEPLASHSRAICELSTRSQASRTKLSCVLLVPLMFFERETFSKSECRELIHLAA